MIKIYFLIISLVLFSACSGKYEGIEKMAWLNGTWQSNTHGKIICEQWTLANDSTMNGASYYIQNTDTLMQETMTISMREGKMFFQTIVIDKDSTTEETRFEMLTLKDDKVEFENLLHDFPQKIVYAKQNKDSLIAYIDGNFNGQYNRINFPMKRIK
ncbi:MAG: hypothetical protein KJ941_07920 [Bacteroidetes bacterium]|nr:hypothetical protein [Bacteroidota bacterium]